MEKEHYIAQLQEGQTVADIFQVRHKKLLSFRSKPGYFLSLSLGDRSGEITARVWEAGENIFKKLIVGDYVRAEGEVVSFQEQMQLNLRDIEVIPQTEVDVECFLPSSTQDRDQLMAEIRALIGLVQDNYCRQLLESIFGDQSVWRRFRQAPAAKKNHQAYLGGLMEHTLGMARLGVAVASNYPGVNQDLLITGVLLHDIGKIKEYQFERIIDYSDEGRLLGHIIIGVDLVSRHIDTIPSFPEVLRAKILHMLASHHGYYEWQSPKRPKFIEACILHHLDLLDVEIDKFKRAFESAAADEPWSEYRRDLARYVFRR